MKVTVDSLGQHVITNAFSQCQRKKIIGYNVKSISEIYTYLIMDSVNKLIFTLTKSSGKVLGFSKIFKATLTCLKKDYKRAKNVYLCDFFFSKPNLS